MMGASSQHHSIFNLLHLHGHRLLLLQSLEEEAHKSCSIEAGDSILSLSTKKIIGGTDLCMRLLINLDQFCDLRISSLFFHSSALWLPFCALTWAYGTFICQPVKKVTHFIHGVKNRSCSHKHIVHVICICCQTLLF